MTRPHEAAGLVIDERRGARFAWFLVGCVAVLYCAYGASMGIYRGAVASLFSALKFPMLYLATFAICFPLFYVLNCLYGQRLAGSQCLRLLLIASSANALAVASFAPFSLLFSLTTTGSQADYRFIIGLQVAVLALAAFVSVIEMGLVFRATAARLGRRLRPGLVVSWAAVYALVLSQMAWVLRPWLGKWQIEYQPLRALGGSFLKALWDLLH
ncbi:MAG: hypothetical protein JW889_07425 [Verrucomicrobia bacterium]|nr:hypothetical protein [Verrucomicrobiota bacterium]